MAIPHQLFWTVTEFILAHTPAIPACALPNPNSVAVSLSGVLPLAHVTAVAAVVQLSRITWRSSGDWFVARLIH